MRDYERIPYDLKRRCVEAYATGRLTRRQVFEQIFKPEHPSMGYEAFRRRSRSWDKGQMADEDTQYAGTYPGFFAHAATVHVRANGDISEAWIRTKNPGLDWDEILEKLKEGITEQYVPRPFPESESMLEIPIFDAHFGVATFDSYAPILGEILSVIEDKNREEIHIIIGQDNLHNNDMRGHTAKGTEIEAVDIPTAWADAWRFWNEIIKASLAHSARTVCHYSRGNHDECLSWAFFKALEAAFPDAEFDDGLQYRKAFSWRDCFIGFGHLEYTKDPGKVFRDFVLDFPQEFATAHCREIHTGHLHRESVDDGIMVRRLASAVPVDDWSRANGFIGAHKRFQLFEFAPGRLRSVIYT